MEMPPAIPVCAASLDAGWQQAQQASVRIHARKFSQITICPQRIAPRADPKCSGPRAQLMLLPLPITAGADLLSARSIGCSRPRDDRRIRNPHRQRTNLQAIPSPNFAAQASVRSAINATKTVRIV